MNYINPHEFAAILDGITHRFILIQEFECLNGSDNIASQHPPRFSIGGYNALIDPRLCSDSILVEITVGNKLLFNIPFRKFYICFYVLLICINSILQQFAITYYFRLFSSSIHLHDPFKN